jgi:hypothetical protein
MCPVAFCAVGLALSPPAATGTTTPSAATSGTSTLPTPVSGVSATVQPVSGKVLVGGAPLAASENVPIGATVDATQGKVTLESASSPLSSPSGAGRAGVPRGPAPAPAEIAQFEGGKFQVEQEANGLATLILKGGDFGVCRTNATRVVRSLWGSGDGEFVTQGRYAAATVRGTVWLTEDRCDGTLVYAKQGSVPVLDLVTKKTVVLKAGQAFLVKP